MRHQVRGRKLHRTSSHKKALLKNLATALFEHKRVKTTEAKAKELRPYAESLITKAKVALAREKQGMLPEGQKIDVHSRRVVGKHIASKAVLQELFDTIAPKVESRPGGYTRITKLGLRRGDGGMSAIIELVDWSAPQDGASSLRKKKKKAPAAPKAAKPAPAPVAAQEMAPEAPVTAEEALQEVEVIDVPAVEEPQTEGENIDAPIEEPPALENPAPEGEQPRMKFDDTTEEESK
ncbi:MAG: 50S ribosomal protein L17 [Chloroflexota bacterium]